MMEDLTDTVKQYFLTSSFELVELKSVSRKGNVFLRIVIDAPGGVTIGDCTRVHKDLTYWLRAEGWEDVGLEVSSPGPRRKLDLDVLPRFVGERIRIVLSEPINGLYVFTGKLIVVEEGVIHLDIEGKVVRIPSDQVKRINLWR